MSKRVFVFGVLIVALLLSLCGNWYLGHRLKQLKGSIHYQVSQMAESPVLPPPTQNKNNANHNVTFLSGHGYGDFDKDGIFLPNKLQLSFQDLQGETITPEDIKVVPAPEKLDKVEFKSDGFSYFYTGKKYETCSKAKLTLQGVFKTNVLYTVILPAGLKRGDESIHPFPVAGTATIHHPKPLTNFMHAGPYYPMERKDGKVTSWPMEVEVLNVNKIDFLLNRLSQNNYDLPLSDFDEQFRMMLRIGQKTVETHVPKDRKTTLTFDLAELLKDVQPGVYAIAVKPAELSEGWHWNNLSHCLVVLTDLGPSVTINRASRQLAVSVRSLTTGKPVPDAEVRFTSEKRLLIAQGKTRQDGTVLLDYSPEFNLLDDQEGTLVVTTKDDATYLKVNWQYLLDSYNFPISGTSFPDKTDAFVYTERGIYRPGETVHVSAFLRSFQDGKFLPAALPCFFYVYDDENNLMETRKVTSNEDGFVTAQIRLPQAARNGDYTIQCGLGPNQFWNHTSFLVGAFTPDRIRLTLKPTKKLLLTGDTPAFQCSADYYFGTPVTGALFHSYLRAEIAPFPPHWKDWTVGDSKELPNTTLFKQERMNFDDIHGRLFFQPITKARLKASAPICLIAELTVMESNARPVSAAASCTFLSSSKFLGLKQLEASQSTARFAARFLAFQNKDIPKGTETIRLNLERLEWDYVITKEDNNSKREWILKVVQSQSLPDVTIDGAGEFSIPDLHDGYYRMTATYGDDLKTVLNFWHWAGDAGSVRSSDPNILTAKTDKQTYQPGETARLTFDAASNGFAIVTVGERDLSFTGSFEVKAGENTIEVPIPPKALTQTAYIALTVVGSFQGETTRAYAILALPIEQAHHKLELKIDAPDTALPSQQLTIQLQATAAGTPIPATVQLFAVDEGILALTKYQTPDIFDHFYGKHYCDFLTYDIYGALFPKLAIRAPRKTGGGGVDAIRSRLETLRLKENALFVLPFVKLGTDGTGSVQVTLPEHTGALRLMAVASSLDAVGSTSRELKMRDRASVLASAPAALASGDHFTASFTLFNHDLDSTDAQFAVHLPAFLKAQETAFKVHLPKGESRVLAIPVQATADGSGDIRYEFTLGSISRKGTTPVNVRNAMPYTVSSRVHILHPGDQRSLTDGPAWKELRDRKVTVSKSFASAAAGALDWLNAYPYGCLEQTASTAFPFLALDNLVQAGLIQPELVSSCKGKVDEANVRLISLLQRGNGFLGWPDGSYWKEPSIYAAHFLAASKSTIVDQNIRFRLKQYLLKCLDVSEKFDTVSRAYACYVLSLLEDKSGLATAKILVNDEEAPTLAKFLAGASLIRNGYAAEGAPAMKQALHAFATNPNLEEDIPWIFEERTTRLGFVATIAEQLLSERDDILRLAEPLVSYQRQDATVWGTTRSNAWATLGLAAIAKHASQNTKGLIVIGDKETPFDTTHALNLTAFLPNAPAIIRNTGEGIALVRITETGIPVEPPPATPGLKLVKTFSKPLNQIRHGDLVQVTIEITTNSKLPNAVLLDILPGGFEIEDGALATRENATLKGKAFLSPTHQEKRQDRFLFFGDVPKGTHRVGYHLRAVTKGDYLLPPARLEDMYLPDLSATSESGLRVQVQ
ncbi:MAG: hypothetical protein IJJ26_13985 [Victivallales bacterium]|nr:hypothetical protein [Victivallales bacterium]